MSSKKNNLTNEEIVEILSNTPSVIVECGDPDISCVGLGGSCKEACKSGNKEGGACQKSCSEGCSSGCQQACKSNSKNG